MAPEVKEEKEAEQCDQIGRNFSLWATLDYFLFYGECTTSRRTNCPKRFHEKIFYLSCIFL